MRILMMAALLLTAPLSLMAQDDSRWRVGVHYYEIDQPDVPKGDHVVVEEVFNYACPHCNSFQPAIGPWHGNLPQDVDFKRVPAIFNRSWEPFARAYLTFEAMGITDKVHQQLFDALHRDHKPIRTIEHIADFVATLGVDKGKFQSTAESFSVNARINQVQQLTRRYQVSGTPSLIIDGKYRIAAGGELKTYNEMLELASYLVEKQRQSRGSAMAAN